MLKTNSKKAINNIWNYIMEDLDHINSGYGYEIKEDDRKATAAAIYEIFESEKYNDPYYKQYDRQKVFIDWAQGLALGGMFDYYYYNKNAVDVLGDILEETKTERDKYTEEQAAAMLTNLIYREVIKNK